MKLEGRGTIKARMRTNILTLDIVTEAVRSLVEMADHSWPDHMDGWNDWVVELYIEMLEAVRDHRIIKPEECIAEALKLVDYNGPGTVTP